MDSDERAEIERKLNGHTTGKGLSRLSKLDTKIPVIYSTDVEATYPSLDIPAIAEAVGEQFLISNLDIPVDEEELALYCAIFQEAQHHHAGGDGAD